MFNLCLITDRLSLNSLILIATSTTFPLTFSNSSQFFMDDKNEPNIGWQEGFLAKFNSVTQNLTWCTLFGGQTSPVNYDLDEVTSLKS